MRVCPGVWQIPHVRGLLAAGGLSAVNVVLLARVPPFPPALPAPPKAPDRVKGGKGDMSVHTSLGKKHAGFSFDPFPLLVYNKADVASRSQWECLRVVTASFRVYELSVLLNCG